jgi:CRP/FNR family transcriptional regulator, cyclic AMP receptor protein
MAADKALLERLKGVPMFDDLSDKELKDVLAQTRVVEHDAGREIVEEGRNSVGFHLILDGQATVSHGDRTLRTLGPGDYFGEISVIDGKPRSATVTAVTPLRSLSLLAWKFQPLLDAHPSLTRKILLGLCETIRSIESQRV